MWPFEARIRARPRPMPRPPPVMRTLRGWVVAIVRVLKIEGELNERMRERWKSQSRGLNS